METHQQRWKDDEWIGEDGIANGSSDQSTGKPTKVFIERYSMKGVSAVEAVANGRKRRVHLRIPTQ
jgi:hypothetical protein